jgi:hypothetical protein
MCTFALQRLALRTKAWFGVITSVLAGNAITLIMPGGAAVGAAVQFRMLATSGLDTSSTVGGLAAFSLLGVGGLLALPVFALPIVLPGYATVNVRGRQGPGIVSGGQGPQASSGRSGGRGRLLGAAVLALGGGRREVV